MKRYLPVSLLAGVAVLIACLVMISCISQEATEELDQEYEQFAQTMVETLQDGIVTQDEADRLELGYRALGGKITIALKPTIGDKILNGVTELLQVGLTIGGALYAVRKAPNRFLLGQEFDPEVAKVATPPNKA